MVDWSGGSGPSSHLLLAQPRKKLQTLADANHAALQSVSVPKPGQNKTQTGTPDVAVLN